MKERERVLEVLTRVRVWVTLEVISVRLDIHPRTARRHLQGLAGDDLVERRESPEGEQRAEWRARSA